MDNRDEKGIWLYMFHYYNWYGKRLFEFHTGSKWMKQGCLGGGGMVFLLSLTEMKVADERQDKHKHRTARELYTLNINIAPKPPPHLPSCRVLV